MTNFSVMTVDRRKNDPPFNPYVYIVLSEYFSDSKGNIKLTPKLMSDMEIDEFIDLRIIAFAKSFFLLFPLPPAGGEGKGEGGGKNFWQRVYATQ